jgi:hypothetical protein
MPIFSIAFVFLLSCNVVTPPNLVVVIVCYIRYIRPARLHLAMEKIISVVRLPARFVLRIVSQSRCQPARSPDLILHAVIGKRASVHGREFAFGC